MFELQFMHPITGKCVSRIFKTWNGWQKHIRNFHCDLNFVITDLEERKYRYGSYHVLDDIMCIGELNG